MKLCKKVFVYHIAIYSCVLKKTLLQASVVPVSTLLLCPNTYGLPHQFQLFAPFCFAKDRHLTQTLQITISSVCSLVSSFVIPSSFIQIDLLKSPQSLRSIICHLDYGITFKRTLKNDLSRNPLFQYACRQPDGQLTKVLYVHSRQKGITDSSVYVALSVT